MSSSKLTSASGGEKQSLLKPNSQGYCLDYDFGGLWRPLGDAGISAVKPGAVVRTVYYGFDHAAVVESVLVDRASSPEKDAKSPPISVTVDIIHLGRPNCVACTRQVMRDEVTLSAASSANFVFEMPPELCYSDETTVSRARSRLNESEWNPVSDPFDFTMWCKIPCRFQLRDCFVPLRAPCGNGLEHAIAPECHVNLPVACGRSNDLHAIVTGVAELATKGSSKLLLIDYRSVASRYDALRPPELHEDVLTLDENAVIRCYTGRQNCEAGVYNASEAKSALDRFSGCGVATNRYLPDWLLLKTLLVENCPQQLLDAGSDVLKLGARKPTFGKTSARDIQPGDLLIGLPDGGSGLVLEPVSMTATSVILRIARFRHRPALPQDAKPGLHTADRRLLVSNRDPRIRFCVHNWDSEDCEVLGGSLVSTPEYSVRRIESTSELSLGLPVSLERLCMFQHAIVVDLKTTECPDEIILTLVYYAVKLTTSLMFIQRIVSSSQKRINIKKDRLFLIEYHVADDRRVTGEAAVRRALSRLGEAEYNIQWNNSRDLVRWCSTSHPTNREFSKVPIYYGRDLETAVAHGQMQVMYRRLVGFYFHHVMMRECKLIFEGKRCDLLSYRCYESAEPNSVVLIERLNLEDSVLVGRVCYHGETNSLEKVRDKANQLLGVSFISEATDKVINDRLLCEWLKLSSGPDVEDLMHLLMGSGFNSNEVRIETEFFVSITDLKPLDHLIIRRNGKHKEHILLLDWNEGPEASCIRFDVPSCMDGYLGPLETHGYMIMERNPSTPTVYVNVRNRPIDADLMDKRMSNSRGRAYYDVLSYNCEHMCGLISNGRSYSAQATAFGNHAASFAVRAGRSLYLALLPLSNLFNLLGHFRYFLTGGMVLLSLLILAVLDSSAVFHRARRFGMTRRELRRRLGHIAILALFSAVSSVLAFLMGHFLSDRFDGLTMKAVCFCIGVPLSLTGIVLCRLADYYRHVHIP
uniref:SET domain-containing protein n=1 Tax=Macrostomum lignano TaxID=282301 RepID=A0A1I8JKI0_9PLAT